MNLKLVLKVVMIVINITGIAMIPAMITALYFGEDHIAKSFGLTAFLLIVSSLFATFHLKPSSTTLKMREGSLIVSMCWILCSIVGSFPYILSDYTDSFINALFESCAGFTTTGATVMNVDIMPKGILMWKAITHWLGGMGILVFAISLLPALGIGGQNIFKAEASGIKINKMATRISDSAKILYLMYIGFAIIEFILLSFSDMSIFDAIINTLGSVTTSGLLSHSAGLAYFDSIYVEAVIAFFTIAASINFSLYHFALRGRLREFLGDIELRVFLCIILFASIFITLDVYFAGCYDSLGETIRYSFFQTASFSTTTGYVIADYSVWPTASKYLLFALMFVGGCGASTCGSIKVVRIIVAFKLIMRNIYQRIHPKAVVAVKVGGKALPAQIVSQTATFIFTFVLVFFAGCLVLSIQGLDLSTTVSSALAMLSNTGIAFGQIGASGNFSIFCEPLRLVLCMLMLFGRLELFTVIFLFVPSFWNPK